MNIVSALMNTSGTRLSCGDKWLVWGEAEDAWVVYQHKYGAKKTTVLCVSPIQDEAIKYLCDESKEAWEAGGYVKTIY